MNLFCIPCAGGSAAMFKKIESLLIPEVKVRPLEMAGRGSRFQEEPYVEVHSAVNDLYQKISGVIDEEDYSFLGFSMGGILAFELCRLLQENGRKPPLGMFFLGIEPPHIKSSTQYHKLNDTEFKEKMVAMGGIPKEVFQYDDLFQIYLPALKADFQLCETYRFSGKSYRFDSKFYLINGLNDTISHSVLKQWKRYCYKCQMDFVPGIHFFINTNTIETCRSINRNLKELLHI